MSEAETADFDEAVETAYLTGAPFSDLLEQWLTDDERSYLAQPDDAGSLGRETESQQEASGSLPAGWIGYEGGSGI